MQTFSFPLWLLTIKTISISSRVCLCVCPRVLQHALVLQVIHVRKFGLIAKSMRYTVLELMASVLNVSSLSFSCLHPTTLIYLRALVCIKLPLCTTLHFRTCVLHLWKSQVKVTESQQATFLFATSVVVRFGPAACLLHPRSGPSSNHQRSPQRPPASRLPPAHTTVLIRLVDLDLARSTVPVPTGPAPVWADEGPC